MTEECSLADILAAHTEPGSDPEDELAEDYAERGESAPVEDVDEPV